MKIKKVNSQQKVTRGDELNFAKSDSSSADKNKKKSKKGLGRSYGY